MVTAHGRGVASHAGSRLLADLAEVTGLSQAFNEALNGLRQRSSRHHPGQVLVDVESGTSRVKSRGDLTSACAQVPLAFTSKRRQDSLSQPAEGAGPGVSDRPSALAVSSDRVHDRLEASVGLGTCRAEL